MFLLLAACTSLHGSAKPPQTVDDPSVVETPAAHDGLIYEVYVRSFQDTDGDGIGDLDGVRAHLPYFDWLGVDTLWLMPLFPGDGPAGYGVTDHTTIRDEYGGTPALTDLVEAAHDRGIRVIMDLPINHVSSEHAWFRDARTGRSRDRFVFADTQWDEYRWFPTGDGSYYYAFFGPNFPDLDWRQDGVRGEMEGMMAGWLDAGVDGFRLDAVNTLIETPTEITNTADTHALLKEIAGIVHDIAPDATVLAEAGEANTAANMAYLGDDAPEADLVLDFPRRNAMLLATKTGSVAGIGVVVQQEAERASETAPFLGSHDVSRLATMVGDPALRRALMAANLTLPGRPVLYYGEELDLPDVVNTNGKDYAWRAPMPWDSTLNAGFTGGQPWMPLDPAYMQGANVDSQLHDEASMLLFVHELTTIRRENAALSGGDFAWAGNDEAVLAFHREAGADTVDVEINIVTGECSVVSKTSAGERRLGC